VVAAVEPVVIRPVVAVEPVVLAAQAVAHIAAQAACRAWEPSIVGGGGSMAYIAAPVAIVGCNGRRLPTYSSPLF
jgi:hypothetical protein